MPDVGEQITGEYLKLFRGCYFVEYNLYPPGTQGEIDVVGINPKDKIVYICEVATHLVTGLQYVKDRRPDHVARFTKKFCKNIEYARTYFSDYQHNFMLWSPIVKNQSVSAKNNQTRDINDIKLALKNEHGFEIEAIVNHEYMKCLNKLRSYAKEETKELKSPILRLMQVEEKLVHHLALLQD